MDAISRQTTTASAYACASLWQVQKLKREKKKLRKALAKAEASAAQSSSAKQSAYQYQQKSDDDVIGDDDAIGDDDDDEEMIINNFLEASCQPFQDGITKAASCVADPLAPRSSITKPPQT